jgi:membrane protease YdiL (CAAX protease family)
MTLFWRILRFPIVKLIIFLIMLAILVIIQSTISDYLNLPNTTSSLGYLGATLFAIMPFVIAYIVLVRVIEQRPLSEFASTTVWRGLAQGMLLGTAMMSLLVGVMAISGVYHIQGWQDIPWRDIIEVGIWAGIVEEILLRGVVLRMLEELFGSWAAILLSGLIFGFLPVCLRASKFYWIMTLLPSLTTGSFCLCCPWLCQVPVPWLPACCGAA